MGEKCPRSSWLSNLGTNDRGYRHALTFHRNVRAANDVVDPAAAAAAVALMVTGSRTSSQDPFGKVFSVSTINI